MRGDSPGDTCVRIDQYYEGKYNVQVMVGFHKLVGYGFSLKCRLEDIHRIDKYTVSGDVILDNGFKIHANKLEIDEGTMKVLEAEEEERRIAERLEFEKRLANL